ncbi:hypothetical protein CLF_109085 [Clonorchis sinensis]|uniref:Endonuclease/exonuclease/phosphatase domain-containing protein n=1 Tax=Clonorchis sinensis TaxID=79923 RepID=G7YIY4_CLOSI|nr:hypothetical protein CLF_109085 [Clonorchis sinensis]
MAAVFGGKCKRLSIFTERMTTHVPTSNVEGQKTVLGRSLTTDQPDMTDYVCRADTSEYSSMGRGDVQNPTRLKNSRGGGCAIYSKTELRATPFVDSSLEGIPETTWISTERTKRPVLVGCIYLPPAPSPDSIADLSRIVSTAHALPHTSKFLLGDFNLPDISWSPTIGPIRYAALLPQLSVEGWSQLVRRPTRGLHTLDLIFSNDGHLATAAVRPCFPGSDHCVVSCNAVSYGQTVPLSPSLFHLLSPDILQAFSSTLASQNWDDFFLSTNTHRVCDIFYQNLLTALHLVSPVKRFHSNVSGHDRLLKILDAKIHRASREYRKSQDFSLLILISKLSTDRESLRALYPEQPPNCPLRFTDSGPVTDTVNIADHLNAYFASCYLPIPHNSEPLLTAASLQTPNGQALTNLHHYFFLLYYTRIGNSFPDRSRNFIHRHTFLRSVDDFLTCEYGPSKNQIFSYLRTYYTPRNTFSARTKLRYASIWLDGSHNIVFNHVHTLWPFPSCSHCPKGSHRLIYLRNLPIPATFCRVLVQND